MKQGYLIFTDGSAYVYDAPSNESIEALCVQAQRGKVFNFQTRRSVAGFVRGFTPPADYETIYSYPPYPGTMPAACPVIHVDWTQLLWTIVSQSPCGFPSYSWEQNGTMSASQGFHISNGTFSCLSTWETSGSLTYNGPLQNAKLHVFQETLHQAFAWDVAINITVNGVNVLSVDPSGPPDLTTDFLFTVPDTGGVAWVVTVDLVMTLNVGFGDTNWDGVFTLSDV